MPNNPRKGRPLARALLALLAFVAAACNVKSKQDLFPESLPMFQPLSIAPKDAAAGTGVISLKPDPDPYWLQSESLPGVGLRLVLLNSLLPEAAQVPDGTSDPARGPMYWWLATFGKDGTFYYELWLQDLDKDTIQRFVPDLEKIMAKLAGDRCEPGVKESAPECRRVLGRYMFRRFDSRFDGSSDIVVQSRQGLVALLAVIASDLASTRQLVSAPRNYQGLGQIGNIQSWRMVKSE